MKSTLLPLGLLALPLFASETTIFDSSMEGWSILSVSHHDTVRVVDARSVPLDLDFEHGIVRYESIRFTFDFPLLELILNYPQTLPALELSNTEENNQTQLVLLSSRPPIDQSLLERHLWKLVEANRFRVTDRLSGEIVTNYLKLENNSTTALTTADGTILLSEETLNLSLCGCSAIDYAIPDIEFLELRSYCDHWLYFPVPTSPLQDPIHLAQPDTSFSFLTSPSNQM